jgi:glycosyltransferase involved in cell wall biosynthesis
MSGSTESRLSDSRPSISAVLPAHNEEAIIASSVRSLADALAGLADDYEVIVCDDGSTDRTGLVLSELQRDEPTLGLRTILCSSRTAMDS